MPLSYETLRKRYSVPNRRGVWTTNGYDSWESVSLFCEGGSAREQLLKIDDVCDVADVTNEVLSNQFAAPDGSWRLFVHSPYQPWASFVAQSSSDTLLRQYAESSSGRWLKAGADPNDGGVKQPSPLAQVLGQTFVMPSDAIGAFSELLKAGVDVNLKSAQRWALTRQAPLEMVLRSNSLLASLWLIGIGATGTPAERVRSKLKSMADTLIEKIDDMNLADQPKRLLKRLKEIATLDLDSSQSLGLAKSVAKFLQAQQETQRDAVASLSDAIPKVMEKIVKASKGEAAATNPPSEAKSSQYLFQPSLSTIERLSETITLHPVSKANWVNPDDHRRMNKALVTRGYKLVGTYCASGQDYQLAGYVQPYRSFYGVIEQIGDRVFCYSAARLQWEKFVVSIDIDVLEMTVSSKIKFDYAICSPLDSIVNQLVHYPFGKKEPLPVSAESFVADYEKAYSVFRGELLSSLRGEQRVRRQSN